MLPLEADETPERVQRQAKVGRAARLRGRGSELGRRGYRSAATRAALAARRVRRGGGDKEDPCRLRYFWIIRYIAIKRCTPLSRVSVASRSDKLPEFPRAILRQRALDDKLNDETCGSNVRKHLLQNASLLGHLEQAGLVRDDTCFIEFGAGKGISLTAFFG